MHLLLLFVLFLLPSCQSKDPLPSWNKGNAKQAIMQFVQEVTTEGSEGFLPPEERIAVFDNDGTLWSEKPVYFQFLFALDRVKELAPEHPEWKTTQPFQAVLENDLQALKASGKKGLFAILAATHTGNTTEEFQDIVRKWLAHARHPQLQKPYTELVFQPMLELLDYLRAHGFKIYIVSGGGIEFMRVFAKSTYGIAPEQVIGSSVKTQYETKDGKPVLMRLGEVDFINDGPGKPVAINKFIGRRPIAAFGNSDGDYEMLVWTTSAVRPSLALLIHHDDQEREWAYDRNSSVGRLDQALDEASSRGWVVVSMKDDWKTIYTNPCK